MKPGTSGDGGGDDESGSGSGGGGERDGAEVCPSAPSRPPGVYRDSLSGRDGNGGACGQGGPDVYFHIEIERRSDVRVSAVGDGFEPRVGVFGNDCALPFDEGGLLCTTGVPGWVSDVAAGTDLFVAVGAANAQVERSPTGTFELDVRTRDVLDEGEPCGNEAWGRCEGGTACLESEGPAVCVQIPGERCGNAIELQLSRGATALSIDATTIHTDDHRHGCGGARVRDRVYRLTLPTVSQDAILRAEGENVLALAARGPTCLTSDEEACAAESDGTPSFEIPGPLPPIVYLFVELPDVVDDESEQSPSLVRLELTD